MTGLQEQKEVLLLLPGNKLSMETTVLTLLTHQATGLYCRGRKILRFDGAVAVFCSVGGVSLNPKQFGDRLINMVCQGLLILTKWTVWVPIFSEALR